MDKPKTKFVQNELKKTKWKNRLRIERLMELEKYASGEWIAGQMFSYLHTEYPKEWLAILKEFDPKFYKNELKQREEDAKLDAKENERQKKEDARAKKQAKQDKVDWKKHGGKS